MEKTPVNLTRSGLCITKRCTLKCKLCGSYIPYYENPKDLSYDAIEKIIDEYFLVVDTVGDFSITGGEPFMHKELEKIIRKALSHAHQIKKLLILTNGTLLPDEETLLVLKNNHDKCQVTISHYGEVSHKAEELKELLDLNQIPCRIINYHGTDIFCDGWVDYNDHTKKHFTLEEIIGQGERCAIRAGNTNFLIMDGEIHGCGRSFRRMELGVVPRNPHEYVDLLDETVSNEEKRKRILEIYNSKYSASCAYCDGLSKDAKRYTPAEQL